MKPLTQDLSIFNKFKFEKPPVGVKYLLNKPEGIKQLDKNMALCEMIKEAQLRSTPFYMSRENEDCAGAFSMGMGEIPPFAASGQIGPELKIFKEDRGNRRLYESLPKVQINTVNYIAFATLDKLTFNPDVLFLLAPPRQAEIVMRAMTYDTGEIWENKTTPVMGCAWLFAYPFISGKVNFLPTGMTFGLIAKEVLDPGQIIIAIPYNKLPTIIQSLEEMDWFLPSYEMGRDKFVEYFHQLLGRLAQESQNP